MYCLRYGYFNCLGYVDDLIGECTNNLYAMNVLRAHRMKKEGLKEVFGAKILSRIMYASPARWGLARQGNIDRINGFLKIAVKLSYTNFDQKSNQLDITFPSKMIHIL